MKSKDSTYLENKSVFSSHNFIPQYFELVATDTIFQGIFPALFQLLIEWGRQGSLDYNLPWSCRLGHDPKQVFHAEIQVHVFLLLLFLEGITPVILALLLVKYIELPRNLVENWRHCQFLRAFLYRMMRFSFLRILHMSSKWRLEVFELHIR